MSQDLQVAKDLKINLAQLNFFVGNISGNLLKITKAWEKAWEEGADLMLTTELSITGYPPEDLVLKPDFLARAREGLEALRLLTEKGGPGMIVGLAWWEEDKGQPSRQNVYNAAALVEKGAIVSVQYKYDLPNYGVFDEKRVFAGGPLPKPISFRGVKLGLLICEDMWSVKAGESLKNNGADLLIVTNASPYESRKNQIRTDLAKTRIRDTALALVYINQVGGQDELVFDGASFVMNSGGDIVCQLGEFCEDQATVSWSRTDHKITPTAARKETLLEGLEVVYRALMTGLADYVGKSGFPGVLIGLSGGIDSALSAAIAVDALGAERVHAVMMPSPYTSRESLEDASSCADRLGIKYDVLSIDPAMQVIDVTLSPLFNGLAKDTTEENIQARIRGLILMALSNKFGYMVLSTGNKSEMSVGYATLYGDMCGGFNVLKDVFKTRVYELADWRNQNHDPVMLGAIGEVIPARILSKAPSAELKSDQTDQDSLPPYPVLDEILECLIEKEMPLRDIAAKGHDPITVNRIWKMLERAEYKRRQAPPGVKITYRSFGRDRRYPIINGFIKEI